MMVACISAAAAIGAIFASAAPTGTPAIDVFYRAIGAGAIAAMTPRARRWSWILAGTVATVGCSLPAMFFGFGSIVMSITAVVRSQRNPVLGALAGGLAAQGLFRMQWPTTFGASAVVGAFVVLCLAGSTWRTTRTATRTLLWRIALGVTFVVTAASGAAIVTVLSVRNQVESGVQSASDGLRIVQDGDQARGAALLADAEREFSDANRTLGGWWMTPADLVPVVSQNARATSTLVADGQQLAARAGQVATAVDLNRLRRPDGSIDLDLFASFRRSLAGSATAIAAARGDIADVSSEWLIPLLGDRLTQFGSKLDELAPGVSATAQAAEFLPSLLGAHGERKYFLMLLTPSESRDLGGHMGNWAELNVTDGRFTVPNSGRTELLAPTSGAARVLHDPDLYPPAYRSARPALFPQNWGDSPDLPTVARAVADLYPQSGGAAIDGVAVIDPYGFAALLKLTGPVTDPTGPTLTNANAASFLLRDQYSAFPNDRTRAEYLTRMVRATIERLRTGGTSSPRDLVNALAPAVHAHQLRFITFDAGEAKFLAQIGLTRSVRAPATGDQLAVLSDNHGPNKMDAFVQRTIDVSVSIDAETGTVTERVNVTLSNSGPTTGSREVVGNGQGLPDGTAIDQISVLTPLRLSGIAVNGAASPAGPQVEFGLNRYGAPVAVRSGESGTVTFELIGRLQDPASYQLLMLRQPLSSSDAVTVAVSSGGRPWSGTTEMAGTSSTAPSDNPLRVKLDSDARFTFTPK